MENKFNNWQVQFSSIVPNSNNPFDQPNYYTIVKL
jgi:hypothetical protein